MNITFLEQSIQNLEKALDRYHKHKEDKSALKDIFKDSCIYRFKNTYEITFKMMKRYLKEASSNPFEIEKLTFNQIIEEAFTASIIKLEVKDWKKFREHCIRMSEFYKEDEDDEVLKEIPLFLEDVKYFISRLNESLSPEKEITNKHDKPDIRPGHLKIVQDILNKTLSSDVKVWVYGNRAKWATLDSSDLDLALEGTGKIDNNTISQLEHDFEESDIPYKVDIVDIAVVQPFFKDVINKDKVLLDRYASMKKKKTIPKGWRKVRLGDLIDIKHGYAFDGKHITNDVNENILVTPDNFHIGGGFKSSKLKYCNGDIPADYILSEGDKIVTMTDLSKEGDTLGYSAKIPKSKNGEVYLHNQRIGLLQYQSKDVYEDFIYWIMRSNKYQQFIVSAATGTSVRHTSPTAIKKYKFYLPPLPEQKAITEILSSLDDKIEQNQNINKALDEMTQAIFKSWFVDFDPVHAKKMALEAGLSKKKAERAAMAVITGMCSPKLFIENIKQMDHSLSEKLSKMSQNKRDKLSYTASLFPNEFVDSNLGLIPKDWSCKSIGNIATVIEGGTPATKNKKYYCNKGEGIPWLTPKDLSRYSWKYISSGAIDITESGLINSGAKIVLKGTVLISSRDPIGYIAIAENKLSINQNFKCLVPHIDTQFLYYWAKSNIDNIEAAATTGLTFKKITRRNIENLKLVVPNRDIMNQFNRFIASSSKRQKIMCYESHTLEEIRDILLSKLLSGEITASKIKIGEARC